MKWEQQLLGGEYSPEFFDNRQSYEKYMKQYNCTLSKAKIVLLINNGLAIKFPELDFLEVRLVKGVQGPFGLFAKRSFTPYGPNYNIGLHGGENVAIPDNGLLPTNSNYVANFQDAGNHLTPEECIAAVNQSGGTLTFNKMHRGVDAISFFSGYFRYMNSPLLLQEPNVFCSERPNQVIMVVGKEKKCHFKKNSQILFDYGPAFWDPKVLHRFVPSKTRMKAMHEQTSNRLLMKL